jgi:GT2 family glycosyltransferase
LFTSGGFMAVDRKKFVELDGFNRLFYPAYYEDLDLCFRAWRRGWQSIYEPDSIVWHRNRGTWGNDSIDRLSTIELRNLLLLQWSTFPMHRCRWNRLQTLVKLSIGSLWWGDRTWIKTYPATLLYWLQTRRRHRWMKVRDRELSQILSHIEEPC